MEIPKFLRWSRVVPAPVARRPSPSVVLGFVGTIDPKLIWTTIGDVMSLYNVAKRLVSHNVDVRIAWTGELFDLNDLRVTEKDLSVERSDAFVFVCGPIHAGITPLADKFAGYRRLAVGVSIPQGFDPSCCFDVVVARDSLEDSTFDLALADIGYPHFHLDPSSRHGDFAICLAQQQREYGDANGHSKARELVVAATEGRDARHVQTLLRRDTSHPGLVELGLQMSRVMITTRMHGALISAFHGVPSVVIDQVRGGAKVTRIAGKAGIDVLDAWDLTPEEIRKEAETRLSSGPLGERETKMARDRITHLSRDALDRSCQAILDNIS